MKKILFSLTLFVAFSFSLSAQMVWETNFTDLGQSVSFNRENLNKAGEKFVNSYYDKKALKIEFYNSNGTVWKVIDSSIVIKELPCMNVTKEVGVETKIKFKKTSDFELYCTSKGCSKLVIADEEGNVMFNDTITDSYAKNSNGISVLNATSIYQIKNLKYYSNDNGVFTLTKTLNDIRAGGFVKTHVSQYDNKYFYEITKDYNVKVYDLNWKLLFTTPIPVISTPYSQLRVSEVSQKLFNTDDKFEFVLYVSNKNLQHTITVFDETGKILWKKKSIEDFLNFNSSGTRMYDFIGSAAKATLYKLPGLDTIGTYGGNDVLFDTKEQAIIINDNYANDKTFSISSETKLIKKVGINNISGYKYNGTTAVELPNNQYAFLQGFLDINATSNPNTNSYIYRIVLPDGKTQDFKNYKLSNTELSIVGGLDTKLMLSKFDVANDKKIIEIYNFGKYAVGTNEAETLTGVSIYPNPFEDKLTVELKNAEQGLVKVNLTNQLGQIVDSKESNETNITMNGYGSYAKGIYFLTIEQNGKKSIQKVVKN